MITSIVRPVGEKSSWNKSQCCCQEGVREMRISIKQKSLLFFNKSRLEKKLRRERLVVDCERWWSFDGGNRTKGAPQIHTTNMKRKSSGISKREVNAEYLRFVRDSSTEAVNRENHVFLITTLWIAPHSSYIHFLWTQKNFLNTLLLYY